MEKRKIISAAALVLALFCGMPCGIQASAGEIAAAKVKTVQTVVFKTHLHCENCVKKVMENISYLKGVKDLDVSLKDQTISVKFDPSKTDVKTLGDEIRKLGYPADEMK